MPKSEVPGAAGRTRGRRPPELPDAVAGQIAEICRDLAVQAKRMRQLQDQADELRVVISQWAVESSVEWPDGRTTRGGRR